MVAILVLRALTFFGPGSLAWAIGETEAGMPFSLSKVVYALSWMAVVVATLTTALWIGIIADGNYAWAAFVFAMLAISANIGILLLAVIPSSILFFRNRQRKDLMSLSLAGCSFVVVLVEAVSLNFVITMRGE